MAIDRAPAAPLVSVVMAVYNGAAFVAAAMDGLLAQTYPNLEFIVIDDGSTDGGTELLRGYAARDPRVRLHEQANTGLTRALVRGVELARGDLIARMDVDDVSLPERIGRQAALLAARPDAVAVSCRLRYLFEDGTSTLSRPIDEPALLAWYLVFYNRIAAHGQMLFRRSAYAAAGGYDPAFRYAQDHDLWSRMATLGPIVGVDEVLYVYRQAHAASITHRNRGAQADCSFRVTCRSFEALTGRPLDRRDAEDVRAFWVAREGAGAIAARAGAIDRRLREAFAAFDGTAAQRRTLRATIAQRWLEWAERTPLRRADSVLRMLALAMRWHPPIAPRAASRIGRRALRR